MNDCNQIIDAIQKGFSQVTCTPLDNGILVNLPFFKPSNDPIQIFVKKEKERYYITDLGGTIDELRMHGVPVSRFYTRTGVKQLLSADNIVFENEDLVKYFDSEEELPNVLTAFVQAILNLQGIATTGTESKEPKFRVRIHKYLAENKAFFDSEPDFYGDSGRKYKADFQLVYPSTNTESSLIALINAPNKVINPNKIDYAYTMWSDLKYGIKKPITLFDDEVEWPKAFITLLKINSTVFQWETDQDLFRETLEDYIVV